MAKFVGRATHSTSVPLLTTNVPLRPPKAAYPVTQKDHLDSLLSDYERRKQDEAA